MNAALLYFKYISLSIRSQMMYKTSFILMSLGNFSITVIEFIGVVALFDRFGSIYGWQLEEIAIFYGTINISFALAESFGRGYDLFSNLVVSGEFDRYLLRPRSFFLQILGMDLQLMRVGRLLQGLFVLIWGIYALELNLLPFKGLILLLTIFGCMFMFIGLFIIQATVSFWSIQSLEVMNAFTYGGVQMGQYPISIYKKWFQKVFTYIIPLSTVGYYPILYILGKEELSQIPTRFLGLMPFVGLGFFLITLFFFQFGVMHYKSTGS